MKNAGKIIVRPMGEYNATTTYNVLDLVTLGNKLYIAKKIGGLTGVTPVPEDTVNWLLLIDGSADMSAYEEAVNAQFETTLKLIDDNKKNADGKFADIATTFNENDAVMTKAKADIVTAQNTANQGVQDAAAAQEAAEAAQTTADKGVADAATAKTQADTGVKNAATAQSTANTAKTNAATAQAAAEAAQSTANTAKTNAATAQTTANTAKTNAATAQTTADKGVADAAAAKTIADTGVKNAATAQSTANTAKTNAATAQTTADTAKKNAATNATNLASYKTTTDAKLVELQGQIDGSITTHFYAYVPTNANVPAKDWTTADLKNIHLGDLFYDTTKGYCYRWQIQNGVYSWSRVADSDATKALADSANALTRALNAEEKAAALEAKINSLTFNINMETGNLEWGMS